MTRLFAHLIRPACCGVILAAVTLAIPCALMARDATEGLKLVFSEDFESGAERWAPSDAAAWKVDVKEGNHFYSQFQASQYTPPVRSPFNYSRIKDLTVGTCVIEARMEQTSREYGHRDMVVIFGYQNPSHFYYTHIATAADAHANSIFLVNGEPRVSIADERTTGTNWTTGYHTVRVARDVASGLIEVYFDDMEKPIMKANDKTLGAGGVGFGTFDDTGNIDDVKIWTKEEKAE